MTGLAALADADAILDLTDPPDGFFDDPYPWYRAQREAAHALEVVTTQLMGSLPDGAADFVVAYEPVWAIGTGLTPTPADVAEIHRAIRAHLVARYGAAGQMARIVKVEGLTLWVEPR